MITVSFDCENHNHAILLATLYDIITNQAIDDSILMIENTSWLVDEIGDRLNEVDQYDLDGDQKHRLEGRVVEVAKLYSDYNKTYTG
ncbi:MAG: hypothetical protein WA821_24015 [Anaerolineales bacterium]